MEKYYTPQRLRRIRKSKNYSQLLDIALEILEEIKDDNGPRPVAMVFGPISTGGKGSRAENLKIFSRAIDRLRKGGSLVFSQMPFENDMLRIFKSDPKLQGMVLLEEFYLPIFSSGAIELMCFLPSWKSSIGANWEHRQAEKLKIPIIYLSDFYTND